MTVNPFGNELAAEHRRDLIQQATMHRLAKDAQPPTRHARATDLTVRVRPVQLEDEPLLAAIFDGLSPASRFARYLAPKRELSGKELRYFADIDHHDHEALIAVTRSRGEPIGVARFVRDPNDASSADVAIEVVDNWQDRGVGSMLAARLAARARSENVTHLTALMAADNRRSQRLLAKMGTASEVSRDGTTLSYRVALTPLALVPQQLQGSRLAPAGCPS